MRTMTRLPSAAGAIWTSSVPLLGKTRPYLRGNNTAILTPARSTSSFTPTNPPDTSTNPPDTPTNPPDTPTNPPDTPTNPPDTPTKPPHSDELEDALNLILTPPHLPILESPSTVLRVDDPKAPAPHLRWPWSWEVRQQQTYGDDWRIKLPEKTSTKFDKKMIMSDKLRADILRRTRREYGEGFEAIIDFMHVMTREMKQVTGRTRLLIRCSDNVIAQRLKDANQGTRLSALIAERDERKSALHSESKRRKRVMHTFWLICMSCIAQGNVLRMGVMTVILRSQDAGADLGHKWGKLSWRASTAKRARRAEHEKPLGRADTRMIKVLDDSNKLLDLPIADWPLAPPDLSLLEVPIADWRLSRQQKRRSAGDRPRRVRSPKVESPKGKTKATTEVESPEVKIEAMTEVQSLEVKTEATNEVESPEVKIEATTEVQSLEVQSLEVKTEATNEVESPEVKIEATNEVQSLEVKTEATNEVESPEVKTKATTETKVQSLEVKTEATNAVESPEVKIEAMTEVQSREVKTKATNEVESPEVKIEATNKVESIEVKTKATTEVESPEVKTKAMIETKVQSLEVKTEATTEVQSLEATTEVESLEVKAKVAA